METPTALFLYSVACAFIFQLAAAAPSRDVLRDGGMLGRRIESLGRNGGRRLAQSETALPEAKCFWDETKDACLISKDTAFSILGKMADSDMKTMATNVAECNYTPTEEECAQKDICVWGNTTMVCVYKFDHADEENFQNCIGDNAVFIEMSPAFKICKSAAPNKDSCNISPTCTWDDVLKSCEFDVWKLMTGIPSEGIGHPLPKGMHELVESRAEEISSQLRADSIEGDDILLYKPTPFICPIGVDMVVCTVAEIADHMTLVHEYCESKRSDDGKCDPDKFKFCDELCLPSVDTINEVHNSQTSAFLKLIKDETSRGILEQQIKCLKMGKSECTDEEKCFFDLEQGVCDVKPSLVLRHLAKSPVNKQNPHCEMVQPIFNSGCMEHKKNKCDERPNCIWDIEDDLCVPGPFALIRGMLESLEGHEDLKVEAAEANDFCYEIKDKEDCV